MNAYSGQDKADLEPHVFSVAEEAYRTMTRSEVKHGVEQRGPTRSKSCQPIVLVWTRGDSVSRACDVCSFQSELTMFLFAFGFAFDS